MRYPLVKGRSLFLAVLLVASCGLSARADEDQRFSRSLPAAELTSLGLASLTSDQVAVLDALVRRDVANSHFISKTPRPSLFSQRLSADERHNAGIDRLTDTQRGDLDAAVQQLITPSATGRLSVVETPVPLSIPSVKLRRDPEIHGSVELTVGVGSHGYSEYGGAMVLSYDDPADRYSIVVGYSELHTKGGYLYRDCRDGFYGRPGLLR